MTLLCDYYFCTPAQAEFLTRCCCEILRQNCGVGHFSSPEPFESGGPRSAAANPVPKSDASFGKLAGLGLWLRQHGNCSFSRALEAVRAFCEHKHEHGPPHCNSHCRSLSNPDHNNSCHDKIVGQYRWSISPKSNPPCALYGSCCCDWTWS